MVAVFQSVACVFREVNGQMVMERGQFREVQVVYQLVLASQPVTIVVVTHYYSAVFSHSDICLQHHMAAYSVNLI